MYICNRCSQTFGSLDKVYDFSSEAWGRTVDHYKSVCPNCGSDDYDEMDKCEICGEYIPPGEGICENCHDLVDDMTDAIRGRLRELAITHKLNYDELLEAVIENL